MPGFPYTSWLVLISMIIVLFSMPFIPGQTAGLITGIVMVMMYYLIYLVMKSFMKLQIKDAKEVKNNALRIKKYQSRLSSEFSKELIKKVHKKINKH